MKKKKTKFNHSKPEHIDAVYNYLSMVSKGLKKRKVTLNKEKDGVAFSLPENVNFDIMAKKGKKKRELSFTLSWKNEPRKKTQSR